MNFQYMKCLIGYALKKPIKLWRFIKFGYVCGTEVCVNEQYKVAYVVNPKVASTSILEMLSGVNREQLQEQGVDISEIRKRLQTTPVTSYNQLRELQERGYLVFTFVRNPYERAISFYKNKFRDEGGLFLKPVLFAERCGFEKCRGFEDVIKQVIQTPSSIGDAHFIPQTDVLYGKTSDFDFDFIGRLERFEQDYQVLSGKVGGLPEVKKRNTTVESKSIDVDAWFSPALKAEFYKRFNEDFNRFNYPDDC
ncbi:sulfotransferase family 2 domain-containing protein [Thiomicrorhabdus sp. zzn3]|uniref:sulfotransferase family 2 domain-containing protein n=1 Tax=Thiomicrorhabdus sp. zzn3 TaxID=3039775 RepID=UPI0024373B55|nr:sulfotransferase family 2 domain-containing protein [Thiomicrorhabdus sp. zzn3]MDG6777385.1 sulfotransferase family 2 domain-containing protein [Thiomicrorhabdus sp. zzn3]